MPFDEIGGVLGAKSAAIRTTIGEVQVKGLADGIDNFPPGNLLSHPEENFGV